MLAHAPSWFDWVVVLSAILFSPVLAVFAQRMIDRLREKKERRVLCYKTLMSLRATPMHPDHVAALNSIDSIFDGGGSNDVKVRNAWGAVLDHVHTDPNLPGWQDRFVDLRVDLYQAVGKAVGYEHTIQYIKNRIYSPTYFENAEVENLIIRQGLAKALADGKLTVTLAEDPPHQASAEDPPHKTPAAIMPQR
jgi:hypothetical protein